MKKKFNYFYEITNLINSKKYYGVHSTDNLYDGYMGSGVRLKCAYKKYGVENFKKNILKYFDTREEAFEYESEIVTEDVVNNDEFYNLCNGGITNNIDGLYITAKDENGSTFWVTKDDDRLKSGVLVPLWKGKKHLYSSRLKIRNKMLKNETKTKRTWINKDGVVKYVKNEIVEEYLSNGWEYGRPNYKPLSQIERKKIREEKKEEIKENKSNFIQSRLNKIKESDIDFKVRGWQQKVSEMLNITPNAVKKFLKRYDKDFYDSCYKLKCGKE